MPSSPPPRHIASSLRIMRATYSRLRWKAPGNFPSILIKSPRASPIPQNGTPFRVEFSRSSRTARSSEKNSRERRRENRINITVIINKIVKHTIHAHAIVIVCANNYKKVGIPLLKPKLLIMLLLPHRRSFVFMKKFFFKF